MSYFRRNIYIPPNMRFSSHPSPSSENFNVLTRSSTLTTFTMTVTHHCPKYSKGGCRRTNIPGVSLTSCTTHQIYCDIVGCSAYKTMPFLLGQGCRRCQGRADAAKRAADAKKKAEEKAKKDAKTAEEKTKETNKLR